MRGEVGSKVTLTIDRQGVTKDFTLVREEISVPTVEGQRIPGTDIGYLIISQFTERTGKKWMKPWPGSRMNRSKA